MVTFRSCANSEVNQTGTRRIGALQCSRTRQVRQWTLPGSDLKVDPEIARAWTLPAHLTPTRACSPRKRKNLLAHLAGGGPRHQVANPGDYFTTDLLGEPLLFVRGSDGRCAVFITSAAIVPGLRQKDAARANCSAAATTDGLTGWTGRCSARPKSKAWRISAPKISRWHRYGLKNGSIFVFVNLDPEARPLRETLGELPKQAEKFPFAG